ncbi:MAG TPA: sugar transferase [Terriglobales bacterium]|jgi:lipopolysaccharide/colanic/teichoic acid biosynthesis glycosyltransferase|nr:sugar transferase [Terriglobales bacterium]
MKRVIDLLVSGVGLIVLSPVFFALALWIKLDSDGPVFHRGLRVGRNESSFRMIKFRSMVHDAHLIGGTSTPEDDPRITRSGKFLRKYKLDELPQLLNVFRGEMSLVGPRPQVPWAVDLYTPEEKTILRVKPGITDYASLRFRDEGEILRGSANPDKDYMEKIHPEKMRLSLEYARTQSTWLDCKILARTVAVVVFGAGERESVPARQADSKTLNKVAL